MSIPPGPPPNPYQQNNPNPYAQQQPQGSVPQQYPYAQPTMPAGVPIAGQPAGGLPPGQPPGAPAGQPAGQPPGAPPFGTAEKKSVPGWLWGLGGVVVASAVWAGALFATGAFDSDEEPEAVLAYGFEKDLCESTGLEAFDERYDVADTADDATGWGSQQKGLDQSFCSWSLTDREADSSDYASSYLSSSAIWHEASDPTGEFAATYKGFEDRSNEDYKYKTEPVSGLGEEAFLVTEDSGEDASSRSMSLAVRDGWFTYEMDWSYYGGGTDSAEPPSYDEVERMLKEETKAALAGLKKKS